MAGVFPLPVQTSGRKQWTLYNGPGRGIQKLGSQLAEDGCPESQVLLAKQLLYEKCDLEVDQEENAKYGVYWLIKASEQGHEEATQILSHCLETGKGISEHNFLDVKSCLDMSQEEKLARTAARKLFESMSGGESFITSKQLQNRILQLEEPSRSKDDPNNQDWKNRTDSGEKLSIDMLTSAASTYSKGEMPIIQAVLCLETTAPVFSIFSLYHYLIDLISRYSWRSLLPNLFSHIQIAFWVGFYLTFGFDTVIGLIPVAMYYGSFAFMLVATSQILTKKRDFYHFRKWSQLFIAYCSGSNLNTQEAEFLHCRNNLKPYGLFFSALLLHLLTQPAVPEYLIPYSELTIIAYIFTFFTVYHFALKDISKDRSSVDFLALFSFAVHVLAKYPYETDTVVSRSWRFIDVHVPTFASYVVGNGVEFCLNFRALFYLLIPAVLIKMASRNNFRGIYTTLIPHCVALAWWQMAIITSEGATWYGLIRSALAMVGLVLFLPLAGLTTVLLPALAAGRYLAGSDEFIRIATTSLFALFTILFTSFLGKIRPMWTTFGSLLRWIQVLIAVMAGVMLVWPALTYEESNYKMDAFQSSLTWVQFREFCVDQKPGVSMEIPSQLHCSQLIGSPVRWEGKITASRLVGVYNPVLNIVERFPKIFTNVISCAIGEKNNEKFKKSLQDRSDHQELMTGCHLSNWNRYEFEVDVSMSSSLGSWLGADGTITLIADHTFKNFTTSLTDGDHIWFAGFIKGTISGVIDPSQPRVNLFEIGCLNCQDGTLRPTVKTQNNFFFFGFQDLFNGFKSVLNFFLNPLVIFR